MTALTDNFSGCNPDNKLYVLWLFYKYADLKLIDIRKVQFV